MLCCMQSAFLVASVASIFCYPEDAVSRVLGWRLEAFDVRYPDNLGLVCNLHNFSQSISVKLLVAKIHSRLSHMSESIG